MMAIRAPRVWLLIDDRPGHRTQVEGLARMMGWPAEERILSFNILNWLPNPVLAAGLLSLRSASAEQLVPPFPDLVIGMGRRVMPVVRWIKQQSGGHSRVVILGRKAGGASKYSDVYVSCAHFNALPHLNLFELAVPPTKVDAGSLAMAGKIRPDPLDGLRSPRIVLLTGGPTSQHGFSSEFAGRMAAEIARAVASVSGDLAIVTSRRTPPEAIAVMRAAAPDAHLHIWDASRSDNPYLSYLAAADGLIVTGESESMLAEAAATSLPLTIYPLMPKPPGLKAPVIAAFHRNALGAGMLAAASRQLFDSGWIAPPRDLARLHQAMVDNQMAKVFDGTVNLDTPCKNSDFDRLRARIQNLLGQPL